MDEEKLRADQLLFSLGLASSRSQAALLIKEGVVFYQGILVKRAGQKVMGEGLEVRKDNIFVGRGAHKLEGAYDDFDLSFKGKVVADIGASTGGFTDFSLQKGALKVYAIDVGHGQLAKSLRDDSRVINYEGVNIRYGVELPEKADFVIVDLSYISLTLVLEEILKILKDEGEAVLLVKPQFEVGKDFIGKGGIVKDKKQTLLSLERVALLIKEKKSCLLKVGRSKIKGKTGNQEYLFYLKKTFEAPEFSLSKIKDVL